MRKVIGNTARSIGKNSTRCWPATARAIATVSRRGARRMTKVRGYARRHWRMRRSATAARRQREEVVMTTQNFPLWEVFIRSRNGLAHKHVGSLHAADAT